MKKVLIILSLIFSNAIFADICDRHEDIQDEILRSLDLRSCYDVTDEDLKYVGAIYLEYGFGHRKNDYTKIEELTPRDLKGLVNLKELSIQQSAISTFDKEAFRDLKNLKSWDFSHNPLKSVPGDLFTYMPNLESIEFDGFDEKRSWEADTLPEDLFKGLTKLKEIDLDDLGFSRIPVGLFRGLISLEKIDFGGNNISYLPVGIFEGLPSLRKLILEGNPLSVYSKSSEVFIPLRKNWWCKIKL